MLLLPGEQILIPEPGPTVLNCWSAALALTEPLFNIHSTSLSIHHSAYHPSPGICIAHDGHVDDYGHERDINRRHVNAHVDIVFLNDNDGRRYNVDDILRIHLDTALDEVIHAS